MIEWAIFLAVAGVIILAIIKDNPGLKILAATIMVGALIFRELGFGSAVRLFTEQRVKEGLWTEQYRDGLLDMLEFSEGTGIFVAVIYLLFLLLCIRGFRRPKQKLEESSSKPNNSKYTASVIS